MRPAFRFYRRSQVYRPSFAKGLWLSWRRFGWGRSRRTQSTGFVVPPTISRDTSGWVLPKTSAGAGFEFDLSPTPPQLQPR